MRIFIIFSLLFILFGCATYQSVTFNTIPEGADIYVNGIPKGKAPVSVKLVTDAAFTEFSYRKHTIVGKLDGFEDEIIILQSPSVWWSDTKPFPNTIEIKFKKKIVQDNRFEPRINIPGDSSIYIREDIIRVPSGKTKLLRIAVLSLKSTTKSSIEEGFGDVVTEMLVTGLTKTGRFEVLERVQIKQILNERNFIEADVVAGESAIKLGKVLQVNYLVIGSVAKIQNLIEVDVRFVDTDTGKVFLAENVSSPSMGDLRNAINRLTNKITADQ